MKVGATIKIFHPKTKELFGTIEKLELTCEQKLDGFGEYETNDSFGYIEWYTSLNEAKSELLKDLENHYSGKTLEGEAEDNAYAAAERFACGGEY